MEADIRLNKTQAIIEAWDVELKAADRQGQYPGDHRRALVHDQGDRLTLNWGHDYQGGITLVGVKTISTYNPPGNFIVTEPRNRMQIKGNVDVDGALTAKVVINWTPVNLAAGWLEANSAFLPPPGIDAKVALGGLLSQYAGQLAALLGEVGSLKQTVSALETRLAAAEQAIAGNT